MKILLLALFSVVLGWLLWYLPIDWNRMTRRIPGPTWLPFAIVAMVLFLVALVLKS